MGYVNPVQYALTQVGSNLRSALESEAERKRLALTEQQQQNQLSLQSAMLANQGRREEAAGQVSLAEVGLKGRQFESQQALEGQKIGLMGRQVTEQETTGQATRDINRRTLEEVSIPTARSTASYQGQLGAAATRNAATQAAQVEALKPYYTAHGNYVTAQANAEQLKIDMLKDPQPVRAVHDAFKAQLANQYGPDYAEQTMAQGRGIWQAIWGDMESLPKDPTTQEPVMAAWRLKNRLAFASDLMKLSQKETLTAEQRQTAIDKLLPAFEKDPAPGTPDEKMAIITALVDYPRQFNTALQEIEATRPTLQTTAIAAWKVSTGNTRQPTADELKSIQRISVEPLIQTQKVKVARELAITRGAQREVMPGPPTPVPVPVPVPGAPVSPPATAPVLNKYEIDQAFQQGFLAPDRRMASSEQIQTGLAAQPQIYESKAQQGPLTPTPNLAGASLPSNPELESRYPAPFQQQLMMNIMQSANVSHPAALSDGVYTSSFRQGFRLIPFRVEILRGIPITITPLE